MLRKNKNNLAPPLKREGIHTILIEGLSYLLLGFEIFVSRILVAIDLHVGNVPFFGCHSLINFNKTLYEKEKEKINKSGHEKWYIFSVLILKSYLLVWRASVSPLQQNDTDNHSGQQCNASECQSKVHGAVLTVDGLVTDRETLQSG